MSNEIAGIGNHTTAEFWEYDPRLGVRWNTDPVVNPGMSPYATMDNNPIANDDPDGDCATCPKSAKTGATHSEKDAGGATPLGGFVYAGKDATLTYTNIGTDENSNWVISSFQNKAGDVYNWSNDKKWYTNTKGTEYDQSGWFDVYDWASKGFGKPLSEGAKNALEGHAFKDTRAAYNQYKNEGGGFGVAGFIGTGVKNSLSEWGSDVTAGGHRSGQAIIGLWQFSSDLAGNAGVVNEGKFTIQNLSFSAYKEAKGGTRTLGFIPTTNKAGQPVLQRVSTEFAHIFITQRAQRALNIPN
ncbi:MAG TPA: hypothetical protein PLQ65_02220, partial [Flavihumibacter sp.]|nr:hypothetical protein [Flavihumibacter sp.]